MRRLILLKWEKATDHPTRWSTPSATPSLEIGLIELITLQVLGGDWGGKLTKVKASP